MGSESSRNSLVGRLPWVIAAVATVIAVAAIAFVLGRSGQSGTDVVAGTDTTTSTVTVPATTTTVAPSTTTTAGRLTASTSAAPSQRTTQVSPRATTPATQRPVLPCPTGVMVARNARFGVVTPNISFRAVEVLVDLTNETNAEVYMLTVGVRYSDDERRSEVSAGDNLEDPNRGKLAPGQRKTYRATITAFGDVAIRGVNTEVFGLWQGQHAGRPECGYPKLEAR